MAPNVSYNAEMIISRLGHRPKSKLRAQDMMVIRGLLPSFLRSPPLGDRPSSFGLLDRFPPEIMSMILGQLDLQSLARLSRASFQADGYVRFFRNYRYLVTHVPEIIQALRRLGLIGLHSADDLFSALRADACAVCGECGPFLFLPTCQRCCWGCWGFYPAFRIMEPSLAKRYYGLSNRDIKKLPVVHVRKKDIRDKYARSRPVGPRRAVSAKAARDLGLAVHGSEQMLTDIWRGKCDSSTNICHDRYWMEAHKFQPEQLWLTTSSMPDIPPDARDFLCHSYVSMPTVPFPILACDGQLEQALWCRGCEAALDRDKKHGIQWGGPEPFIGTRPPPADLQRVLPPEYLTGEFAPPRVAAGLADRAWSQDRFVPHVRRCLGARLFAPELADIKDEEWDRIINTDMKR